MWISEFTDKKTANNEGRLYQISIYNRFKKNIQLRQRVTKKAFKLRHLQVLDQNSSVLLVI